MTTMPRLSILASRCCCSLAGRADPCPAAANMTFFVPASAPKGGDLGRLRAALTAYCQSLGGDWEPAARPGAPISVTNAGAQGGAVNARDPHRNGPVAELQGRRGREPALTISTAPTTNHAASSRVALLN